MPSAPPRGRLCEASTGAHRAQLRDGRAGDVPLFDQPGVAVNDGYHRGLGDTEDAAPQLPANLP